MQFFLDTANIDQIKEAKDLGLLDGVTTNPTLLGREGGNWVTQAEKILKIVEGPVSLEVVGLTHEEMIKEALELVKFGPNVVVKVPMIPEGLKALKVLKEKNIDTNVTLIFSANQALLAAKLGARFISPFIGRLDALGQRGMDLVEDIVQIIENYDFDAQCLVASVRHPEHITEAALAGAHVATLPWNVMNALYKHPLTDKGLEAFLADWEKAFGKKK